jgi:hypothetical protein
MDRKSIYPTLTPIGVKESENNIGMITKTYNIHRNLQNQQKISQRSSEILGKNLNTCNTKCIKELDNKNHAPSEDNNFKYKCMVPHKKCTIKPTTRQRWEREFPRLVVSRWWWPLIRLVNPIPLWEKRCNSLNENVCESSSEWPRGSGGRCSLKEDGEKQKEGTNEFDIYDFESLTSSQIDYAILKHSKHLDKSSGCVSSDLCNDGKCASTGKESIVKGATNKTGMGSIISTFRKLLPSSLNNSRRLNDVRNACDIGCAEIDKGNIAEKNFIVNNTKFPIRPSGRILDAEQIIGKEIPGNSCDIRSDFKCGWNSKCIDGTCKIKKMCFFGCAGSDTNNQNIDPKRENLIPSKLNIQQYKNEGNSIIYYFEKGYINNNFMTSMDGIPFDQAKNNLMNDINKQEYYGFYHDTDKNKCYMQIFSNKSKPSWKTKITSNDDIKNVKNTLLSLGGKEGFAGASAADTKIPKLAFDSAKTITQQTNNTPGKTLINLPQSFPEQKIKLAELKNESQKSIKNIINKIKEINEIMGNADKKSKDTTILALKQIEAFHSERLKIIGKIEKNNTYDALAHDNQMKKKSNDIMYYIWLTLAIAILLTVVRKIK